MNAKLRWILETWFGDDFHCKMLEKAINSKRISLDDFISGFEAIRDKQYETSDVYDRFVPDVFEKLKF